jgi:hypothetical protein
MAPSHRNRSKKIRFVASEIADKVSHVTIHNTLRQRILPYATVVLGICCCLGVLQALA